MKILITGGTGLIGSAFIQRYSDYDYTLLTRSIDKAQSRLSAAVNCIESLDHLENLDAFDAVLNLAGEPIMDKRWSESQKIVIGESRWRLTQQLVDLFAKSQHPPAVFLSGSAIGVYGNRGDQALTEITALQECDFPTKVCMRWEAIAQQAQPYTRVVLLRTGIVLAAHAGALAKMLLPFKCAMGGRIADGRQYMSWIHYRDHIRAMHFLLTQNNLSGPVNLVSPEVQRNKHFTQILAAVLKRIAILAMPKAVLKILLGESACLLIDSQNVKPQKLLNAGFRFEFSSLQTALIDLLHSPLEKKAL